MEVNMKEWILRYAEQQNEEEKNENSKSLEEEEKFDPVSRNLYQAFKLDIPWKKYLTFLSLKFPHLKLKKYFPLGTDTKIKQNYTQEKT